MFSNTKDFFKGLQKNASKRIEFCTAIMPLRGLLDLKDMKMCYNHNFNLVAMKMSVEIFKLEIEYAKSNRHACERIEISHI